MIYETIKLKEINKNIQSEAVLDVYVPSPMFDAPAFSVKKPLLIIPGGAYEFVSEIEGEPVAIEFMARGFATFVLKYTVGPYFEEYLPIKEAFAAVAYIKENAKRYNLDVSNFSVVGFSAGGHLTATLGMMYKDEKVAKMIAKDVEILKIDNVILSYPVISMKKDITHQGTMYNRTLEKEELIEKYSIENHVTSDYPRTFIWATKNDDIVDVINSKIMAESCKNAGIDYEIHIFPDGPHGLSVILDKNYINYKVWVENATHFINTMC
jgi:acetyl esterase/lipase